MDYEQKYKEALERIRKYQGAWINKDGNEFIQDIFPELKMSEDEMIRKEIIEYLEERQIIEKLSDTKVKKNWIAWLEKQCEQKPVELKFKVGDWIVYEAEAWREVLQIETIESERYTFTNGSSSSFAEEQYMRLWTIQDAKDGDVLEFDFGIGIFKKHADSYNAYCYCYYNDEDGFVVSNDELLDEYQATPANAEQRVLLFSKIGEAGYTWDAEQKQLKKIDDYCKEHCKGFQETGKCYADGECKAKRDAEQNPTWSEDDEKMYKAISIALSLNDAKGYLRSWYTTPEEADNWLKSIKNRVGCEVNCTTIKQWSEEDEYHINTILNGLDLKRCLFRKEGNEIEEERYNTQYNWLKSFKNRVQLQQKQEWSEDDEKILGKCIDAASGYYSPEDKQSMKDWLESLKNRVQPQWKPTDEQMSCFKQAIDLFKMKVNDDLVLRNLNSLYENLKNFEL